jgi:hypothetical protein
MALGCVLMKTKLYISDRSLVLKVMTIFSILASAAMPMDSWAQMDPDSYPNEQIQKSRSDESQGSRVNQDMERLVGTTAVHVECQFRQTSKISCNEFIRGFFAETQSVVKQEENLERADITLSLIDDVDTGANTRYTFAWKSKDHIQVSDFEYYYVVDQGTLDEGRLQDNLIRRAAAGISMYLDVMKVKAEDGTMTASYQSKNSAGPEKPDGFFERLQKSPLFINAGLDGSYRTLGQEPYQTTSMSLNPDVNVIYLKDRYKIDLYANYKKTMTSVPSSSGGTLSAETDSRYFRGFMVYTMKRRWSVAVVEHIGMDNAANTKMFQNATAGLEWALVPFRTNENKELTFRVGATHHILDLYSANGRGNLAEQYVTAFARLYAYWNSVDTRTNLRVFGGYEANLKYEGYEKYNVGATISYQLNRSTKLSMSGYYNYLTKSLTYPGSPDFSNPLMVQQMTGQAGRSLTTSVGIDITIGNTLKKSRDRRWSGDTHSHGH